MHSNTLCEAWVDLTLFFSLKGTRIHTQTHLRLMQVVHLELFFLSTASQEMQNAWLTPAKATCKIIFSYMWIYTHIFIFFPMEFMITPWAAYGIQFRFSGIETGAVAMHCYKEGKKDWIRLGRAWHKIVHTCKGFV